MNVGAVREEAVDYLGAPLRDGRMGGIGGKAVYKEFVEYLEVGTTFIE